MGGHNAAAGEPMTNTFYPGCCSWKLMSGKIALGALGLLFSTSALGSQPQLLGTSFDGEWVARDARIQLRFEDPATTLIGAVAVFVGRSDLTELFFESDAGELTYHAPQMPLPAGSHDLIVYYVADPSDWVEIARVPLQVLTDAGFEQADWTPRVELSIDMQNKESVSGDAFPSARPTYQDLNVQAGMDSQHRRGGVATGTRFQLTGTSNQDSALRVGEKGDDAPKLDLADYSIGVEIGATSVTLGHVSYGEHPLLLSGLGHRGVVLEHEFNDFFDVAMTSQSGRRIVGWDRFLGANRQQDRISGATVGVNLLEGRSQGRLRAEFSYVTAKVEAESGFGFGMVPVAEKSDGWGFRLLGSGFDDRLRGQLQFARSTYVNPTKGSPEFEGVPIVDVEATTNNARMLGLEYDLIRGARWSENRTFDLSISFDHERIDPQYRTLAAFPGADIDRNRLAFRALLGPIGLSGSHAEQRDNLDRLDTVLTTKTRASDLTLDAPLASLLGRDEAASPWWPGLYASLQRVHQFATNAPPADLSDFDSPSHLPDQMNTSQSIGLDWYFDRWNLGYQFSRSHQDNRQEGRKDADFTNLDHRVDVGVQVLPNLRLGGDVGISYARDHERGLRERNPAYGVSVDWQATEAISMSARYNGSRASDNLKLSTASNDTFSVQLAGRFAKSGARPPIQAFVRYSRQDNRLRDNEFDFETAGRSWAIHSGLNVTF